MSRSTNLLRKLSLQPDLSVGREPIKTSYIKHFTSTLKQNYSTLFLQNLLFALFLLPLGILLLYLLPLMEKVATANLNFAGDIGMGFPGATNDVITGMVKLFDLRILYLAYMIPCFTLAGIGAAGIFYVCRNLLWGAKVKVRIHFFRGIKKYWWQFMIIGTIIGAEVFLVGFSVLNHLKMQALGNVEWWSYLLMIGACIIALATLIYGIFFIPMMTMYRFKAKDLFKNSAIMSIVMVVMALILLVVFALPALLLLSQITKLLLYMFIITLGASMYALGIQTFGVFVSDNFIKPLYQQEIENKDKQSRKKQPANKAKTVKAKPANQQKKSTPQKKKR